MKTAIQQEKLPADWSTVELGELLERITNGLTCEQEKEPPGIPVTRIETISNGVVDFERVRYVRDLDEAKKARFILQRGDILFSHVNSDLHLGKTAVVTTDKPLLHGMNLLLLRTKKEQLDPYYLHYLLNYYRRSGAFMAIAQHAVNQSSLNQKKINSLKVPLVPLDQQKRIVAEIEKQFSRLDEAVANLKRVKANLKRYKAAVLKAAVEGCLVETEAERARREGRSYETGAQLLQLILETRRSEWKGKGNYKEPAASDTTELPELPEGWVWASAEQVCGSVRDGTHDTPDYVEAGVPLITSKNLTDNGIDFENVKFISQKDHIDISRRSGVEAGDVLFAMIGTVGNPCEIKTDVQFSIKNVGLFKRNPVFLDSAYLCYWLASPQLDKWLEPRLKGTTQKFAPLGLLREIPVPLIPVTEQHRIVAEVDRRLSLLRETEAQVDANLLRADRVRQSMLSKAFSGLCYMDEPRPDQSSSNER